MSAAEAVAAEPAHSILPIEGMTCVTCVSRVERALSALPGVRASVNLSSEQAEIEFDPTRVSSRALAEAVETAGYEVPRETRQIAISGMTCATCAGRIETALKGVPGATRVDVNLASERASVEGIAGILRPADLVNALFASSSSDNLNGVIAGFQGGYNWMASNWLIAGIEADIQLSTQNTTPTFTCPGAICNPAIGDVAASLDAPSNWIGSLRYAVASALPSLRIP